MSIVDSLVKSGEGYSRLFHRPALAKEPRLGLTVISCMDCRIQVEPLLGLAPGDAHILRNGGAVVTDDVLRSVVLSQHLLHTRAVMLIAHTGCGLLGMDDRALNESIAKVSGVALTQPMQFHAFTEIDTHVRDQMERLRAHPWIFPETEIRGFVLNVDTGALTEVPARETRRAA